ncbi:hypothetical protein FSARC_7388 [Fusarium sarcochroum]|uniref:Uncharacterized protein n=1 Tax=Fusarium sarcochroum TaxID=1208366 RepID=A0A8H4X8C1_9HYPO|nr:hypothetical protein FSARC_7388 [Fusarium sarcochroum]
MPQGTFSNRVHSVWDRVTRRRDNQRPQRYADLAAAQRRTQDRASRLTRGSSLPDLLSYPNVDNRPDWRPADAENPLAIYPPARSPSLSASSGGQLEVPRSSSPVTILRHRLIIPVVAVATSHTGSTSDDESIAQNWTIPGTELFPEGHARPLNAVLFSSTRQMYRVNANGRFFMIPIDAFAGQPGQGFLLQTNIPEVHGDVFALLLEIFTSPNGLIGHENGLNLPLLLAGLSYALDRDMTYEVEKLKGTIDRYIALRMFHQNSHVDPFSLGIGYFKYRSEEIYRSWVAVVNDARVHDCLDPRDVVALYVYLVDHIWWPGLIADFDEGFREEIESEYFATGRNPGSTFEEMYRLFLRRTGLGIHPWMRDSEQSPTSKKTTDASDGDVSVLSLDSAVIQPPISDTMESHAPEDNARRIRRETAILPPADMPIEMIGPSV